MTPEEEVVRAGQAQNVLDAQVFKDARAHVDNILMDLRHKVPIRDSDMHTRLILMEQLWGNLTTFLEQTAQTGRLAQLQIAEKRRFWPVR